MTAIESIEIAKASVPVIAALIVVFGGAVAYRLQKAADRRSLLLEARRSAYSRYMSSLYESIPIQQTEQINLSDALKPHYEQRRIDAIIAIHSAFGHLMSVASDDVANSAGAFNNYMNGTSKAKFLRDNHVFNVLFSKMVIAMRRDSFISSKMTDEQITNAWRNDLSLVTAK